VEVALAVFRATLRLTWADPESPGERVFSYWNNEAVTPEDCDHAEVMHVVRASDGAFRREIAHFFHAGDLEDLEEILHE
jgi:hypothetical protein